MESFVEVNKAFSNQSLHYDNDDNANPILQAWRQQVYNHVNHFIKPSSHILELNSGTGIDALHFVRQGHRVHCVELSDGMVQEIASKIRQHKIENSLSVQQLSYEELDQVEGKFDYVFSNFGGLNCSSDLKKVTKHLQHLLKPVATITWVIMPPVCLWEIAWMLKGEFKDAFRRFHKNGVMAHLEGEYFKTYYFTLADIQKAFGENYKLLRCEGLGALSPPPSATNFITKHPSLYKSLTRLDENVRNHFPFNRWADHIVVTMKYLGR